MISETKFCCDVGIIDQACSVKKAGYWPSSVFACLWTETKSRHLIIFVILFKFHGDLLAGTAHARYTCFE